VHGGESSRRSGRVLPKVVCLEAAMCNSMRLGAADESANYEARPPA